ncbi:HU family DNA-binding protein [Actinomyces sp. zg-332]|uniref:HU family DNA-binding protein n=1 Tax=Actinomyces sp. zg-332 TaxID=2708340 RepID=UPI0014209D97|nr:HU family DNA-binding protein [Actinomyces sp. zg-332]QPK93801.1 HU family DNA-binding protein [Actinomyces sp. zg-332]
MNRSELVAAIAERAGLTKSQADAALTGFADVLTDALCKGETIRLTGILTAERVERAARVGRNPRTGEQMQIAAGYGVKISAGLTLKKAVANS